MLGRLLGLGRHAAPSASSGDTGQTSGTRSPEGWLIDLFGGMLTSSGLRMTPHLAMSVPGVAAAVEVLAGDLSKVPINVYRKVRGGKELAVDHPLMSLLNRQAAPWLPARALRRALIEAALTRGNGYARVRWDGRGQPTRITLIKPGFALTRWTEDGEPVHDVFGSTVRTSLTFQDVLHVAYRSSGEGGEHGGVIGISPIQRSPEPIALAVAAERFAGAFFRNGARPSFVIETDKRFPDDEVARRTRAQVEEAYRGLENAFKIAILELGMKLKEFSFNNRDSQLVEVRKEAALTMCQLFGVPPHKVGILDRATFSNIEHQGIDYVTGTLASLAAMIESAICTTCLTEFEQDDYIVEHDLDDLKRGDMKSRYEAYAIGRQWGWLNADEIRAWENQNELPDGQGKKYMTPLNMNPGGRPVEPPARNALLGPDGLPLKR